MKSIKILFSFLLAGFLLLNVAPIAVASEAHSHGPIVKELDFLTSTHTEWDNDLIFTIPIAPHQYEYQYQSGGNIGWVVSGGFTGSDLTGISYTLANFHGVPENTTSHVFTVIGSMDVNDNVDVFNWDPEAATEIPEFDIGSEHIGSIYKRFTESYEFSNGHRDDYYLDISITDMNLIADLSTHRVNIRTGVNHTPEPATMFILGPALLGIFGLVRNKKNR